MRAAPPAASPPPPRCVGRTSQRSQALIEFALVSPVLLLLMFGVIDVGRAIFYYDTINHAAREGARTAVRASNQLPTDTDVVNTVIGQMAGAPVFAPCPDGPVTTSTPPPNAAWVYITEPNPPATVETTPPPNAPGGESSAAAAGSRCSCRSITSLPMLGIPARSPRVTPLAPIVATSSGT